MKYKRFYITTKTPLRVSLFGGGSDIENFFNKKNGHVVTTAINKFIYVTIKNHDQIFGEKFRLNYSTTESSNQILKIKNKIIRACLKKFEIDFPIYISTISDLPSNSGLGSSSSFTVGLLKALYELKGVKISPKKLALEASKIEINDLKNPIGLQDQFIAAYGGFKYFQFKKNYIVNHKSINPNHLNKIFKKSLILWTSLSRDASKLLKIQNSKIKTNYNKLNEISLLALESYKLFKKKKFDEKKFIDLLIHSWNIKKKLSNKVSNKKINVIYDKLSKLGLSAAKICGAGGGGFLFIIYKNKKFVQGIKKFKFYLIKPWSKGSEVIYSEK